MSISTTSVDGMDAVRSQTSGSIDDARQEHVRRIAYFMLFRLAILAGFTVLVGVMFYARSDAYGRVYMTVAWVSLIASYALTIYWAWRLPKTADPSRIAAGQTAGDIVFAAIVVQMTGGVDSGFVTLYLIAVLGAATMGGRRQTWAAAAACTAIYVVVATLQLAEVTLPLSGPDQPPIPPREIWANVARTLAGIAGVTVLSSYLSTQLSTSALALDKLRALNDNIVRSLNSGLLTVDSAAKLLYSNPTANEILGLSDADIGRRLDELLPGLTLDHDGVHGRQELVVNRTPTAAVRIGLSHSPLTDAEGTELGHVVNFQDLTRLHELTQRVRRNDRLAALGGLAASVAHEIRNPLAAISGSAELLGTADLSGEDAKLLEIIRRESNRLSDLITDLLAFTRPRQPQTRPVDVTRTTAESCEAFRVDPSAANIDLQLIAPPFEGEQALARLDPTQLSQVLWNLLRNAAEAMGGEGTLEVRVTADDRHVRISVQDDGPGMEPEVAEQVFDPFFTTKESGTGFGLAIVHRVVEENGGTVTCESVPPDGSTFTMTFDRHLPSAAPEDSGVLSV